MVDQYASTILIQLHCSLLLRIDAATYPSVASLPIENPFSNYG